LWLFGFLYWPQELVFHNFYWLILTLNFQKVYTINSH
jgi:hypothetical protein